MRRRSITFCVALLLAGTASPSDAADKRAGDPTGFFKDYVKPILTAHCYECHSHAAGKSKGGLVVDSRNALITGGDSGAALVPGDPGASLLIKAVEYGDDDMQMPPKAKLSDTQIKHLRQWVAMGAPDPRQPPGGTIEGGDGPIAADALWSLKPVRPHNAPDVRDASWSSGKVDRFVLARLEQEGLTPAGDAEPERLLRRVYYDLLGLPPDPRVIERFTAEPTTQAYERIVDELLASRHFGERWGRHWLDVARYAETNGKAWNMTFPYAWRYRDYVINAFNSDKPFDRFVREQIAGDLMPAASTAQRDAQRTATGFLALGSKTFYRPPKEKPEEYEMDWVDDQLNTLSRSVLGLTVECARCHDHKFDPIPTRDYYALAGIFLSTETRSGSKVSKPPVWREPFVYDVNALPLGDEQDITRARDLQPKFAEMHEKIDGLEKKLKRAKGNEKKRLEAEIKPLKAQLDRVRKDAPKLDYAFGVVDAENVGDTPIRIRGEWDKHGDVAPRGFLSAVPVPDAPTIPDDASGRAQLADWLTLARNPLTPRVIVNRIWHHLFGRGVVATVDNFGANGDEPTHPRLLDDLAHRFVHEHRWSIKSLIRELVTSRTYRLSSAHEDRSFRADPDNHLLWRARPRRLDAESIRDSLLTIGGTLDREPLRGSAVADLGYNQLNPGYTNRIRGSRQQRHRSVYLAVLRTEDTDDLLKVFDFPDPSLPIGKREVTTVPLQSLYMMNSEAVIDASRGLVERLMSGSGVKDGDLVEAVYLNVLNRRPSEAEVALARRFVERAEGSETDRWAAYVQALLMSAEFQYLY